MRDGMGKFRGKRISDGDWVYGSLIIWRSGMHGIMNAEDNIEWRVDPSTLGQFTGLQDKSGKEIWEGDVVEARSGLSLLDGTPVGGESVAQIKILWMKKGCWGYSYIWGDNRNAHRVNGKEWDIIHCSVGSFYSVIGTIHDKEATK